MILPGELALHLAETFDRKIGTVQEYAKALRPAGLLSTKGHGRSAARMDGPDFANWTLALIIDHERGASIADNVRRLRALPFEYEHGFGEDWRGLLKFARAATFGEALDGLMHDLRSGRFANVERSDPDTPLRFSVLLDEQHGEANFWLRRQKEDGPFLGTYARYFRNHGPVTHAISRHVTISDIVLRNAATLLGPIEGPTNENDRSPAGPAEIRIMENV